MKTKLKTLFLTFQILLIIQTVSLSGQVRFESPPKEGEVTNKEIYKARRLKLLEKLENTSILILKGSSDRFGGYSTSGSGLDDNFYYLTGLKDISNILILIPSGIEMNGKNVKEIIFVRPPFQFRQRQQEKQAKVDEVKEIPGFDATLHINKFQEYFQKAIVDKKILYLSSTIGSQYIDLLTDKKYLFDDDRKKFFQEKYPSLQIKPFSNLLAELREVKDEYELAQLQKAIDATCKGSIEAMKSCEPGMYEYELQGALEYVFKRDGCEGTSFPSIIGSGPNSLILHYMENSKKMNDGEMVVMDIGAQYKGYAGDVTRTIPVNGKFSKPQKDLYSIVLKANEEIIKSIKSGIPFSVMDSIAQKVVADGLLKLGFIKDRKEGRKFLPHGVSHNIGLNVHDRSSKYIFRPGQVITNEPGIYIPPNTENVPPEYWNIGIRIEDDVLITKDSCKVLSSYAPKSIEEIEKLMKKKGVGNIKVGGK